MTETFQRYLSFHVFATCTKTLGAISISPGPAPVNTFTVSVSQSVTCPAPSAALPVYDGCSFFSAPSYCHTLYISPSNVPTSIPHSLHISSNQYTTPSTHQFQPVYHTVNTSVPTSIPHGLHISSNQYTTHPTHQFQPVYHTAYTSVRCISWVLWQNAAACCHNTQLVKRN